MASPRRSTSANYKPRDGNWRLMDKNIGKKRLFEEAKEQT